MCALDVCVLDECVYSSFGMQLAASCWSATRNMPTAQEVREYLEHHGIQAAVNAAVNGALQSRSPNPLEFISDFLIAKGREVASGGDTAGVPAPATAVSDAGKDATAALIPNSAAGDASQVEKDAAAQR